MWNYLHTQKKTAHQEHYGWEEKTSAPIKHIREFAITLMPNGKQYTVK